MENNFIYDKYREMTDEYIIELIHNGDNIAQDYIIDKYKNVVRIKSRTYFLIGGDREDLVQEGMIGLYKAIRDYNKDKMVKFYSFAELCIRRQIITAIKSATRQKHGPLNSYISLNKPVSEGESLKSYIDILEETCISNPEDIFIGQEDRKYIEEHMLEQLSDLESKVLYLYLQGSSYVEIASITNKNEKAIDNALQRIRKKVEKIINEKNLTKNNSYARI